MNRALAAKMEEYYALDCEDFVAGLPCRFKYKTVTPNMYGLKPEEILTLSDKALNQVVSLKKLAPYREAEPKPRCALSALVGGCAVARRMLSRACSHLRRALGAC